MRTRAATLALAFTMSCLAPPLGWAEQPFRGAIEVTRIVTEVRVIAHDGSPILGLAPTDFRATVDGQPVEVESAEWVAQATLGDQLAQPDAPGSPLDLQSPLARPGRLIVMLFQTDFHRSRLSGLLRIDGYTADFVRRLAPTDHVAVAVMGSHLQLHADFTRDLRGVCEQLAATDILEWHDAPDDGRWPSLARHFDRPAARRATTLSQALEVIGNALEPVPGTKAVVLLGWGIGQYRAHSGVVQLEADSTRALRALAAARTSVFSLDLTSADRHSLEVGLERLAADTGGFFIRTHLFPQVAVDRLARTLTAHYELTPLPPDGGVEEQFKVKITVDRPGAEVLDRRIQFSKAPARPPRAGATAGGSALY